MEMSLVYLFKIRSWNVIQIYTWMQGIGCLYVCKIKKKKGVMVSRKGKKMASEGITYFVYL